VEQGHNKSLFSFLRKESSLKTLTVMWFNHILLPVKFSSSLESVKQYDTMSRAMFNLHANQHGFNEACCDCNC
jgi:hypothetical protein